MNILGINHFYHDSSACIVTDGELRVAIEEERLTRDKHTGAFPRLAIARCLEMAGLEPGDIDAVAVSIRPTLHWPAKLAYAARHPGGARSFLRHELINSYYKQKALRAWFEQTWPAGGHRPRLHFVPHHLAHVAGTFFVSPYERAALLSLDGSGEWATSFLGLGEGNRITCFNQSFFPHSLGSFYEAVTEFCGFRPNYDEGKTMGLAPFGDPERFLLQVREMVAVSDEGDIRIDLSWFSYQFWGRQRCGPRFHQVFGPPRRRGAPIEKHHEDTAAAFQQVLEEAALGMCRMLRERTGCRHLVVAGGVALNSVMNGRIVRESGFDDIYVMPAAGDNGTAIGAAYYIYNGLLGRERNFVHENPYVGTAYDDDDIAAVLRECKLKAEYHEDIEVQAARLLRDGHIIGWFQGRMEIGPRALGNRSILADPTRPDMKDRINAEVKHREAYRPFAPSVPVEAMKDYFDSRVQAPFMLKVCNVLPDKREVIPAVTHVDGSARMQSVRVDINPRYHRLLNEFGRLSGVPVLLNTSFNVMGEPIVESPLDAIRCFFSTGLDRLVLGNYLVSK